MTSEVCACGHSIYDHKAHKLGVEAERFREAEGTDCERPGCVCAIFNSVLETSDARVFRSPTNGVYNFGPKHPLTLAVKRVQESNKVFMEWHTIFCDECYEEISPDAMTPVNDGLYCDTCLGSVLATLMIGARG
jgi:hypothetical protein